MFGVTNFVTQNCEVMWILGSWNQAILHYTWVFKINRRYPSRKSAKSPLWVCKYIKNFIKTTIKTID